MRIEQREQNATTQVQNKETITTKMFKIIHYQMLFNV